MPREISVINPRSFCPQCKSTLRWYDLIPILSYILLKRRCRNCNATISFRYPLIEAACGTFFLTAYILDGLTGKFVLACILSVILVSIFLIDWSYLVVPNSLVIVGISLTTIVLSFSPAELLLALESGSLAMLLVFLLRVVSNFLFRKDTMGIGDIKLSFLVGSLLGMQNFFLALWTAAILGCIYWVAKYKSSTLATSIKLPFGSFLSLTSYVIFLFSNQINDVLRWMILPQ